MSICAHFERFSDVYRAWDAGQRSASSFDLAVSDLVDRMQPFSLRGWHCTRLTEGEMAEIRANGMRLPNQVFLHQRVDQLERTHLISAQAAKLLRERNSAADSGRAEMLWFCFFRPGKAGEGGIGRFFKHWGGEALYVHHEGNLSTSPELRRIGTPCIVEAEIPISFLRSQTSLALKLIERKLRCVGRPARRGVDHEGAINVPLPAENIRRLITYPHYEFRRMTGCDRWREPIPLSDQGANPMRPLRRRLASSEA